MPNYEGDQMKKALALYYNRFATTMKKHKTFKPTHPINPQAYILLGLFGVATIMYILELANVLETNILNVGFYLVLVVILFIVPLFYIIRTKKKALYFADNAIILCKGFKACTLIAFEDITKVMTDHQNTLVIIGKNNERIDLNFALYDDELRKINDIIKYRGFYKEEAQEFTVDIIDGNIVIEVEQVNMDEETSHLFEKFIKKYSFLTPGFLDDLIFYNNQIDHIQLTEAKHVIFYVSHLDVKPTHPENTTFKAHKTDDAIVVFENIADVTIHTQNKSGDETLFGDTIQAMRETTKNAVIYEAEFDTSGKRMQVEFLMSHANTRQRVRFTFTQVIVGWNKLKDLSWFEK